MSNIAEVVFRLSQQGIDTLRDPNSGLPPELRALLAMVDGVSPVAQYRPFLRAMEPIDPKFLGLEEHGLLERVGTVSDQAVADFQQTVNSGAPFSTWGNIDSESPLSGFVPFR